MDIKIKQNKDWLLACICSILQEFLFSTASSHEQNIVHKYIVQKPK
jgi:hypothetical protein